MPAIARTGTPTEPLAKPLSMPTRIVIEADDPGAVAGVLETIGRLLRKNGRIVLLDD